MARKPEGTEMSVMERIRALKAEEAELTETAKTAAMEKANEAIAELAEIGLTFHLVEGSEPQQRAPRKASSGEPVKRTPSDKSCEICGFKTDKPHDRRSHRSQQPKRPFTDEELKERGMVRV